MTSLAIELLNIATSCHYACEIQQVSTHFKDGLDLFKLSKPHSPNGLWKLSEEIFNRISKQIAMLPCGKISSSGAPSARRAAKRSPIPIEETNGNPWIDFLVVIMASGIARARVRTTATATVEWRKMAAILQVIGWQTCSICFPCTF